MFTGIVEELGEVVDITALGDASEAAARLMIQGSHVTSDITPGDSVAVNGVCLTAATVTGPRFGADVMKETLDRSTLGALRPGTPVNLERAARLADRMGGHIVQGHVDGTATVVDRESTPRWDTVRISLPEEVARYVVEKGSIAVDGVSLTVASTEEDSFTVGLVPATLERTTLGRAGVSDPVNLEVDIVAKYVARMVAAGEVAR